MLSLQRSHLYFRSWKARWLRNTCSRQAANGDISRLHAQEVFLTSLASTLGQAVLFPQNTSSPELTGSSRDQHSLALYSVPPPSCCEDTSEPANTMTSSFLYVRFFLILTTIIGVSDLISPHFIGKEIKASREYR